MQHDNTNTLQHHVNWVAEKKLPNEPPIKTALVCDKTLDMFIGKYQEVMRDIKERYQQEQAQLKQNSSYAKILAKQQQRANEQNQNKTSPQQQSHTTQKTARVVPAAQKEKPWHG